LSELVIARLLSSFDFKGKTVALFLPIARQMELNTYPLIHYLENRKVKWCIPKTDLTSWTIAFYSLENIADIQVNRVGIPEPMNGELIETKHIDVCITPLLAHDLKGTRIGYGKGCYDKFFSTCNPSLKKIGLTVFDRPLEQIEEISCDIKMDFCITPFTTYRF